MEHVWVICCNDFPVAAALSEDAAERKKQERHDPESGRFYHFHRVPVLDDKPPQAAGGK